jgi:hypothetical protein
LTFVWSITNAHPGAHELDSVLQARGSERQIPRDWVRQCITVNVRDKVVSRYGLSTRQAAARPNTLSNVACRRTAAKSQHPLTATREPRPPPLAPAWMCTMASSSWPCRADESTT